MASGASDKARFYLEQSIPELQQLERKKIFTKEEISSIAKKRSDFEHTLNAPHSQASDFVRYAEFEMNLEALRQKRVKRLGVKNAGHSGQRRIFFILDRGTRKFKNDVGLWMQYIEYAKKQKSNKKLAQIFTSVLRLHPTKPELWIFAARYAMDENADMTNARSYMQRGLRFNKQAKQLWLEYTKLEMIYVAKIVARQQILGLNEERPQKRNDTDDMMMLPEITAEDVAPKEQAEDDVDEEALQRLATSPAMSGAIPIAIFDAAMAQFPKDDALPAQFFGIFTEFDKVPCVKRILQHILDYMGKAHATSAWAVVCKAKLILFGVDAHSVDFPAAIGAFLDTINGAIQSLSTSQATLAEEAIFCLTPYLVAEDLDAGIERVLSASLRKYCLALEQHAEKKHTVPGDGLAQAVATLRASGKRGQAWALAKFGAKIWPLNTQLASAGKGSEG